MKELVLAILASGGLFSFVQFFITFGFSRKDKTKEIEKELKTIKEDQQEGFRKLKEEQQEGFEKLNKKVDYNAAVLARTHILRFNDEILNGMTHSREYWRQQLDDCDTYEEFCKENPDFKNSYTEIADENIKNTFAKLMNEGKL